MHLDAAFLLPRLRIAPNTLENEVREQADGGGVDDLQPLHPLEAHAPHDGRKRPVGHLCGLQVGSETG